MVLTGPTPAFSLRGCCHACPKFKISLHNNSNELALPLLINGKSLHPLVSPPVIIGTSVFWIDGVCRSDANLCSSFMSFMLTERSGEWYIMIIQYLAPTHCKDTNDLILLSHCCLNWARDCKYQIKIAYFSILLPSYVGIHIYELTWYNQMRSGSVERSDSREIKGDTANSAGRHQTWVLALTFSMTMGTE